MPRFFIDRVLRLVYNHTHYSLPGLPQFYACLRRQLLEHSILPTRRQQLLQTEWRTSLSPRVYFSFINHTTRGLTTWRAEHCSLVWLQNEWVGLLQTGAAKTFVARRAATWHQRGRRRHLQHRNDVWAWRRPGRLSVRCLSTPGPARPCPSGRLHQTDVARETHYRRCFVRAKLRSVIHRRRPAYR